MSQNFSIDQIWDMPKSHINVIIKAFNWKSQNNTVDKLSATILLLNNGSLTANDIHFAKHSNFSRLYLLDDGKLIQEALSCDLSIPSNSTHTQIIKIIIKHLPPKLFSVSTASIDFSRPSLKNITVSPPVKKPNSENFPENLILKRLKIIENEETFINNIHRNQRDYLVSDEEWQAKQEALDSQELEPLWRNKIIVTDLECFNEIIKADVTYRGFIKPPDLAISLAVDNWWPHNLGTSVRRVDYKKYQVIVYRD